MTTSPRAVARAFSRTATTSAAAAMVCAAALAVPASADSGEVNIYSYREPKLIQPMLDAFTAKTGIRANVVFAKEGLIERMATEGRNSPSDVLLTNESGWLTKAKDAGVLAGLDDAAIKSAVPEKLRDPDNQWFGLTQRARVVYASKDRVKLDAIRYEDLADPKWRGKICTRSGQHTYNVALVASMIANDGVEKAEAWLKGVRDNLARKPAGGDREQVRDVQAGLCDLAIGNTYYMAAMLKNPEQKAWADAVYMLFPNAKDRGTHVNITGMGLAAHAPNKDNAVKLMHFLVSEDAQKLYAEGNGEYPVVHGVAISDLVKSWGELHADPLPLAKIGALRKEASELIDRVGFDKGPAS